MKILDWIFDKNNCRTHPSLKSSMTGEFLVRSTGGVGLYTTNVGMKAIKVSHSMTLGNNASTCKQILNGELDFCLTLEEKSNYITQIKDSITRKGEYRDVKYDRNGHIYFTKGYWCKQDLNEIKSLLEDFEC